MNLSVGIVGLPNVGKSTLFNALLGRQIAQVAEYPFTTIEPHTGVVEIPDDRLKKLCQLIKPAKCVPSAIKFVDIAGLVEGAAEGKGLGNKFLSYIRDVDAILHIVRGFANEKIAHVTVDINPRRDIDIVTSELKKAGIEKPTIYVLNVSEEQLKSGLNSLLTFKESDQVIEICAKLEADLALLTESEQKEYLSSLGIKDSGLDRVIREAYKLLDLLSFFTIKGGKQVQAWPLKRGAKAINAAELVHSDFAKGFIKAEVISLDELMASSGWVVAKEEGKVRLEGREYVIKDGDVVEFKFSL